MCLLLTVCHVWNDEGLLHFGHTNVHPSLKRPQKHSMRSRQSSQLSLLQAPGTSITEVDEGHSTFTRTPSNDASNPSSRATSPCSALFYIVGSPNPRGSSDRGTPQRISSTERQDSLLSSGHYRRQGGQGEDLPERLTTPDEREELEMSLEVYSPSFQRQHEDKDQATETGGGDRDTPTLDSTAEDSSITLVKSGEPLVRITVPNMCVLATVLCICVHTRCVSRTVCSAVWFPSHRHNRCDCHGDTFSESTDVCCF